MFKLLSRYKRMVIQLSVIIVSMVMLFIVFNSGLEESIKNQVLAVLTGVLTGAVLSFIYLSTEKKIVDEESSETMQGTSNKIIEKINESTQHIGKKLNEINYNKDCAYCTQAIRCFSNRDKIMLGDKFYYAKNRIYIFTTNLLYLTDSMSNIEQAIKNNVDIKILVLKPTSMFVKIRYKELGFDKPKDFFDELNISIRTAIKKKKEVLSINSNAKFEIKTHLHTPTFMLYIIDDELYFNPIVPLYRGRNSVHIFYNLNDNHAKSMAKDYIDTFNSCWHTASDVEDNYVFDIDKLESLDDKI